MRVALPTLRTPIKRYSSEIESLKSYSNQSLIDATARAIKTERSATVEVVRHLSEIARRKLYVSEGYATLFDMLTRHFGYCAGSAQRRINAMRLVIELPEVEKKIESGELTLTAASQVQSFFHAEKKENKSYAPAEKLEVISTCLGKSTREVARALVSRNPEFGKKDIVRPLSETESRVSLTASNALLEKLEKLKGLLSHKNTNMKLEDVINSAVDIAIMNLDPAKKISKIKTVVRKPFRARETSHSRHIPAANKKEVWRLNQGTGCEFVNSRTKQRCGSKYLLQIDHIKPFSMGGTHAIENLRLLCAQHNRWSYSKNTRAQES